MSDKKYEYEEANSDRVKAIGGIASGVLTALGVGMKMYSDSKAQQQRASERENLKAERRKLEQELDSYNNRFMSFLYEDEKSAIKRKIALIDDKLKTLS